MTFPQLIEAPHRNVLLKLSYEGMQYSGYAYQTNRDTVEGRLLRAIKACGLLPVHIDGPNEAKGLGVLNYHKCGRTDAGVTAHSQYVSLYLRTRLPQEEISSNCRVTKTDLAEEYPYHDMINHGLPIDIRIIGWIGVDREFSARFSCIGREYEYVFFREDLDIQRMQEGCKRVEGHHWMGRLAKHRKGVDPPHRSVDRAEVLFVRDVPALNDALYKLRIRARSFLHNQVRRTFSLLKMHARREIDMEKAFDPLCTENLNITLAEAPPLVLKECFFGGGEEREFRQRTLADREEARIKKRFIVNEVSLQESWALRRPPSS